MGDSASGNHLRARSRWAVLPTLILAGGLFVLTASRAQAGENYFERGFEGELGRIAAHEAVYLGKHLLGHVLYPPYGGAPRYGYPVPAEYYRYERRGPPYGRAVGHYRRHHRKPCGYGRYERYEEYRDGYGGYERYERRYGPGPGYGYYD